MNVRLSQATLPLVAVLIAMTAGACAADELVADGGAQGGPLTTTTFGIVFASFFAYATTVPGLMLYFAGMVRRKNVLSAMMQCLALTLIMSIVWVGWGYSLAFGDGAFFGGFDNLALTGIGSQMVDATEQLHTSETLAHCLFFGAAFVLATCLMCGALVERMRLLAMVLFCVLWGTLVFCPLCHLTLQASGFRGTGWFAGTIDSSGGQAIHIAAGVSALVSALLVGRRLGYGMDDMRPHNLTYTTMGTAIVWLGALGIHFGMALCRRTPQSAVNAVLFTHLAMAGGAISWAAIEWVQRRRASILGIVSGVVAGFSGAAAGAGEMAASLGIIVGLVSGAAALAACGPLKSFFKYDDSLDIFGVHAVAGAVGLVLVACCAGYGLAGPTEVGGFWTRLGGAGLGLAMTSGYALGGSLIILKGLDWSIGLRVPQETEMRGLDLSQHGQEGYIFN